jgi:hypothetical protein
MYAVISPTAISRIPRHLTYALAWLSLGFLVPAAACHAQAMAMPAVTQFPLFAKILSYDRQLTRRANGEIVVGILYQSRFRPSLNAGEMVLSAIQHGSVRTISGIPVRAVLVDISGGEEVAEAIASSGANVLYVTPLRTVDVGDIHTVTKRMHLVSMTGVPEYVGEGIALGIDLRDDQPLILINIRAAMEEGADLSSQVLKVAKILP